MTKSNVFFKSGALSDNFSTQFKQQGYELKNRKIPIQSTNMVTVVRCKDCKHYITNTELLGNVCNRLFTVFPMTPDDFCSYGEWKGEQE